MKKFKFSLLNWLIILGTTIVLSFLVLGFYYLSEINKQKIRLQAILMPVTSIAASCQSIEKNISVAEPGMPICLDYPNHPAEEITEVWPSLPSSLRGYSYRLNQDFIEGLDRRGRVFVRCNTLSGGCEQLK
ncbi:MAG TPA: hypothetical protein GX706_01400 [Candidatus Moranbacteria bacterium]|nr:hypothetical protein [Candidatus Moranbacteria bacterium]